MDRPLPLDFFLYLLRGIAGYFLLFPTGLGFFRGATCTRDYCFSPLARRLGILSHYPKDDGEHVILLETNGSCNNAQCWEFVHGNFWVWINIAASQRHLYPKTEWIIIETIWNNYQNYKYKLLKTIKRMEWNYKELWPQPNLSACGPLLWHSLWTQQKWPDKASQCLPPSEGSKCS